MIFLLYLKMFFFFFFFFQLNKIHFLRHFFSICFLLVCFFFVFVFLISSIIYLSYGFRFLSAIRFDLLNSFIGVSVKLAFVITFVINGKLFFSVSSSSNSSIDQFIISSTNILETISTLFS